MSTYKYTPETKTVPPAPAPAPAPKGSVEPTPTTEAVTPREGTEPGPGLMPHSGGGFAKTGVGGFSGGCVPEAPPPPEGDVMAAKKK